MERLEIFNKAVEEYVRPETYPVAIKIIENKNEIPQGIQTVQSQLGITMALCQGWGKVRFNGESLAMLKEDISCPIALFTLGLAAPPLEWDEGSLYIDWMTSSEKAASNFANSMYRLPKGKYVGVIMAPIHDCNFEPDMVMVYCNPLQLLFLVSASLYDRGGRFDNSISPLGVCTDIIAPVMQTGQCRFGIPCVGDRKYECTSKDEVVFSAPTERLNKISDGLAFSYEHGELFRLPRALDHASEHLETYRRLREIL